MYFLCWGELIQSPPAAAAVQPVRGVSARDGHLLPAAPPPLALHQSIAL